MQFRCVRYVILFVLIFQSGLYAQDSFFETWRSTGQMGVTLITDPSISKRCKKHIERRQKKLAMKNKIKALIQRNHYLQKMAPKNKRRAKIDLKASLRNLRKEYMLVELKIKNLEETIVRNGCPGIHLRD